CPRLRARAPRCRAGYRRSRNRRRAAVHRDRAARPGVPHRSVRQSHHDLRERRMTVRSEFDAGTLEIMWSRLTSIADEAATTLVRTSFSTVVRESKDLSCALFDSAGCSLAQAAM